MIIKCFSKSTIYHNLRQNVRRFKRFSNVKLKYYIYETIDNLICIVHNSKTIYMYVRIYN